MDSYTAAARDARRAARLEAIEQFQRDLTQYAAILDEWEGMRADFRGRHHGKDLAPTRGMVELRTSLLRRAGTVRPVYQRVLGSPVQQIGNSPVSFWQLALFDMFGRSQAYYARTLAESILMLLGELESDPSPLDPPESPRAAPSLPQSITVNVGQGGMANVAQTAAGDISQSISPPGDAAEIIKRLEELDAAISELGATEEEQESFRQPVTELQSELRKETPLRARVQVAWGAISSFATITTAWQGGEFVQRKAAELAPLVTAWLRTAGGG